MYTPDGYITDPEGSVCPHCGEANKPCSYVNSLARSWARQACAHKYRKKMRVTVYSKDNCPYCVKVKEVLEYIGAELTVYTYDKDFTRAQFYDEFGEGTTFPQVIIEEEHIGGCTETIKHLKEQGLV